MAPAMPLSTPASVPYHLPVRLVGEHLEGAVVGGEDGQGGGGVGEREDGAGALVRGGDDDARGGLEDVEVVPVAVEGGAVGLEQVEDGAGGASTGVAAEAAGTAIAVVRAAPTRASETVRRMFTGWALQWHRGAWL